MLCSKIQVLCFHIFYLICYFVYSTCLEYTAFLASGIYVQSAQIEFNVLNAINALYEICHVITLVIYVG